MRITDVRTGVAHPFAVGLHDQAQHAVRRGMLRTHVDQQFLGLEQIAPHRLRLGGRGGGISHSGYRDTPWATRSPCAEDARPNPRTGVGVGVEFRFGTALANPVEVSVEPLVGQAEGKQEEEDQQADQIGKHELEADSNQIIDAPRAPVLPPDTQTVLLDGHR